MDWITGVVVFGAGALFGLMLGLFLFGVGEIEGKPRRIHMAKKELEKMVTTLKERVDILEKLCVNQLKINDAQVSVNNILHDMIRTTGEMVGVNYPKK